MGMLGPIPAHDQAGRPGEERGAQSPHSLRGCPSGLHDLPWVPGGPDSSTHPPPSPLHWGQTHVTADGSSTPAQPSPSPLRGIFSSEILASLPPRGPRVKPPTPTWGADSPGSPLLPGQRLCYQGFMPWAGTALSTPRFQGGDCEVSKLNTEGDRPPSRKVSSGSDTELSGLPSRTPSCVSRGPGEAGAVRTEVYALL